jgi:hypothetical protein
MNTGYDLVLELLAFVETQAIGSMLEQPAQLIGKHRLWVLAINILPWLKGASKPSPVKQSSIFINPKYTWHNELVKLIEQSEEFRALLVYDGESVTLSPLIPDQTVQQINEECEKRYNPRLMEKREV